MAEYIEREAAVKALLKDAAFCVRHLQDGEGRGYIGASKTIGSIPAADVAPVRHGHWIEASGYQICSECGEEHAWDEYRASYCEDCGARMDGGDEDAL